MKKTLRIIGKVLNVLCVFILILFMLLSLWRLVSVKISGNSNATVFGFSTAVVLSGSMEPEIRVDDLIITHSADKYCTGDIVMFERNDTTVTHRIISETEEGFITKGDANNTEDPDVLEADKIIGKVVITISNAGKVISFIRTPLGTMILVILFFLLIELPLYSAKRRGRDEEK